MRIAVFLPNGAEWALLFWASVKIGSIFVSLDERAVPRKDEVHHFFDLTKPCAIFVSSSRLPWIWERWPSRSSQNLHPLLL